MTESSKCPDCGVDACPALEHKPNCPRLLEFIQAFPPEEQVGWLRRAVAYNSAPTKLLTLCNDLAKIDTDDVKAGQAYALEHNKQFFVVSYGDCANIIFWTGGLYRTGLMLDPSDA